VALRRLARRVAFRSGEDRTWADMVRWAVDNLLLAEGELSTTPLSTKVS
jgi:hypothetical protein